ncbi:MAG: ABC transporter ATP-binding protein [Candidatus Sericytochromatia bacterium]
MSYREAGRIRPILRELSVGFRQGAFSVLLGPSGCGKSTLLNLIAGLDRPDTGRIRIGQTELTALSERERTLFRRQRIGIIFQFFNLLPSLTVLENVLLPLQLNKRKHEAASARDWLGRVGLADRADSYPDRLSGGEQQRVAIVRALLHDPLLLLADEPTGNLDEATAAQVTEMLLELVHERRQTLIMVTHNPELATRADAVYRMHEGRLEVS